MGEPSMADAQAVVKAILTEGDAIGIRIDIPSAWHSTRTDKVLPSGATRAGTRVWFEYVPSGANIADLPSRGDFDLLAQMGSKPFDVAWPPVGLSWRDAFRHAWKRASPSRPSTAAKRAFDEIQDAISEMRGVDPRAKRTKFDVK